jgi:hypothetical protein
MASKWKVKDGTQVNIDGKLYGPGDTFSATQEEIDAEGAAEAVEKAEKKSNGKAQASSPNKAQASSSNKSK